MLSSLHKQDQSGTHHRHCQIFPQHTKVPNMTTREIAIPAAEDLIGAINQPTPIMPISPIGNKQMQTIKAAPIRLVSPTTLTQHKTLPRVPPKQHTSFPRVVTPPIQQSTTTRNTNRSKERNAPTTHGYSTRQQPAPNWEQAHDAVITVKDDANSLKKPLILTEVHWANAIIDLDTCALMEYRPLESPKHCTA
jgi:hypothetical protein